MRAKAFTLTEMLTCLAVMVVVAAIMTPVIASAKRSAKISSSLSNLHQMHLGLKLYQVDEGGEGKYGSLSEMGLPTGEYVALNRFGTPLKMWQSPCGQNPSWESAPIVIQYNYRPEYDFDDFEKIAPVYKENLVMFSDMNCADHGEPLRSDYLPHLGLGVLLSGSLEKVMKPGDNRFQRWWAPPQG